MTRRIYTSRPNNVWYGFIGIVVLDISFPRAAENCLPSMLQRAGAQVGIDAVLSKLFVPVHATHRYERAGARIGDPTI